MCKIPQKKITSQKQRNHWTSLWKFNNPRSLKNFILKLSWYSIDGTNLHLKKPFFFFSSQKKNLSFSSFSSFFPSFSVNKPILFFVFNPRRHCRILQISDGTLRWSDLILLPAFTFLLLASFISDLVGSSVTSRRGQLLKVRPIRQNRKESVVNH